MNYLQLCRTASLEAGLGAGPTSLSNQPLEYQKLAMWVARAWTQIQVSRSDWRFMWQSWSYSLPAGKSTLAPATASITDLKRWDHDSVWLYPDGQPTQKASLPYKRLEDFIRCNERYAQRTGKPEFFTEDYDRSLKLSGITDAIYVLGGRYYKTAQVLSAQNDTPILDSDYHDAIVYRALMMYAAHEEAGNIYADANANWRTWETRLVNDFAPNIALAPVDPDS